MKSTKYFFQLLKTKKETDIKFSQFPVKPNVPYQNLWALEQHSKKNIQLRFMPDLSLHLVFDLSGKTDVEPFLIYAHKSFIDFEVTSETLWVGMQFKIWDGAKLLERKSATAPTYYARFDVDWVNWIYFWLLEARNRNLRFTQSLQGLKKFHSFISESVQQDFETNFFEVISSSAHKIEMGYSDRHQRRLFHKLTLLSPVQFKRIVRFQNTLQSIIKQQKISWSEYYDQAHFIREFKQFTGVTPVAFLNALKS